MSILKQTTSNERLFVYLFSTLTDISLFSVSQIFTIKSRVVKVDSRVTLCLPESSFLWSKYEEFALMYTCK